MSEEARTLFFIAGLSLCFLTGVLSALIKGWDYFDWSIRIFLVVIGVILNLLFIVSVTALAGMWLEEDSDAQANK